MCLFDQLPHVDISAQLTICDDSSDGGVDMECVYALASTCDVLGSTFHSIRIVYHNVQGLDAKMTEVTGWLKQSINTDVTVGQHIFKEIKSCGFPEICFK